jgi:3alpha(or 20beta)-hydroxysteroid dehydrogenase
MGVLDGKVALVTGGARGMGEGDGAAFVREGATVYLTDVLGDEGRSTAERIGATFLDHDVTDPAQWAGVVARVVADTGRLDVLVNNAGVLHWATMTQTAVDDWNRVIAINQTGVFLGMQAAAAPMMTQGSGSIINISSIGGYGGGSPCFAYAASKWALRGMTKGAARELGPFGIRVNSVHPGIIDTPMMADQPLDQLAKLVPLGRYAGPDDVARTVLWLASDESAYCSGGEYLVDGGYLS